MQNFTHFAFAKVMHVRRRGLNKGNLVGFSQKLVEFVKKGVQVGSMPAKPPPENPLELKLFEGVEKFPTSEKDPLFYRLNGKQKQYARAWFKRKTKWEQAEVGREHLSRAREKRNHMEQLANIAEEKSLNGAKLLPDEKEALAWRVNKRAKTKKFGKVANSVRDEIKAELRAEMLAKMPKKAANLTSLVREICEKNDYDPISELVKKAQNPKTSASDKLAIAKMLLPYISPTLKAIDISGQMDNTITVRVERFGSDNPDIERMKQAAPAWNEGDMHQIPPGKLPAQ
jgi:hypothetical protein